MHVYSDNADAISLIDVPNNELYDPLIVYRVAGQAVWDIGIDNSDSNKFKIAGGASYNNIGVGDMLTIDVTGNVGIGTTAPAQKLQVSGGRVYNIANNEPYSFMAQYGAAVGQFYFGATNAVAADGVFSNSAGTERMRITDSGNIGIGTTNPGWQAVIGGTAQTTANIADSGSKGATLLLAGNDVSTGSGGALLFGVENSGNNAPNNFFAALKGLNTNGASYTTGDLAFSLRNAITDTALTERMRITAGGNVGIGTTAPGDPLHVAADASTDNGQLFLTGATNPLKRLRLGYNTTGNYGVVQAVTFGSSFDPLALNPSGGNVGIGTTAPSRKLVVDGTGLLINGNNAAGTEYEDWPTSSLAIRRSDDFVNNGITMASFGYRSDPVYFTENSVPNIRIWTPTGVGSAATSTTSTIMKMSSPGPISLGSGGTEDRLYINTSGYVGIGTSNPGAPLEVNSTATQLRLKNPNSIHAGGYWKIGPDGNNSIIIYNQNNHGVWIGNDGAAWESSSDERLKTDIRPVEASALLNISLLNPVTYKWRDKQSKADTHVGFIAQEIRKVFPLLVSTGPATPLTPDGTLSIDYTGLTPYLVKAMQELKAENNDQSKAIDKLRQEFEAYKKAHP